MFFGGGRVQTQNASALVGGPVGSVRGRSTSQDGMAFTGMSGFAVNNMSAVSPSQGIGSSLVFSASPSWKKQSKRDAQVQGAGAAAAAAESPGAAMLSVAQQTCEDTPAASCSQQSKVADERKQRSPRPAEGLKRAKRNSPTSTTSSVRSQATTATTKSGSLIKNAKITNKVRLSSARPRAAVSPATEASVQKSGGRTSNGLSMSSTGLMGGNGSVISQSHHHIQSSTASSLAAHGGGAGGGGGAMMDNEMSSSLAAVGPTMRESDAPLTALMGMMSLTHDCYPNQLIEALGMRYLGQQSPLRAQSELAQTSEELQRIFLAGDYESMMQSQQSGRRMETMKPATTNSPPILQRIPLRSDKAHGHQLEESCVICSTKFECDHDVTTLPCNHIYHVSCISTWLDITANCPLCRRVAPSMAAACEEADDPMMMSSSGGNGQPPVAASVLIPAGREIEVIPEVPTNSPPRIFVMAAASHSAVARPAPRRPAGTAKLTTTGFKPARGSRHPSN